MVMVLMLMLMLMLMLVACSAVQCSAVQCSVGQHYNKVPMSAHKSLPVLIGPFNNKQTKREMASLTRVSDIKVKEAFRQPSGGIYVVNPGYLGMVYGNHFGIKYPLFLLCVWLYARANSHGI